jgi:activator of 2-hydroxyglutaryl-CoA dehydratase
LESVSARVASLANNMAVGDVYLTGGLCENAYVIERLAHHLGVPVTTNAHARFAGAIGAALSA